MNKNKPEIMNDSNETDREHFLADLGSIVVEPEEVVDMLYDISTTDRRDCTRVFRIMPPFRGTCRASVYFYSGDGRYPDDCTPPPVHIQPLQFVDDPRLYTFSRKRTQKQAMIKMDDPSEEEIQEYIDEAEGKWRENVRESLVEEINVYRMSPDNGYSVPVIYNSNGGDDD